MTLAGAVTAELHDRITADCRKAPRPFTGHDGTVAAPIEVHLIVARA